MIYSYESTKYIFYEPVKYGSFCLVVFNICLELLWRLTQVELFSRIMWSIVCSFGILISFTALIILFSMLYKKNKLEKNNIREDSDDIKENMILLSMIILFDIISCLCIMIVTRVFISKITSFILVLVG